ncbi:hypothetical protein INT46_011684 [Mucor plumbeus]|uniref:Uncharacterized protein n=1 Tax=Mucor plumbeus TaxID=97098 RepID=A0A8H7QCC1_9FUNG|nr:hypothetical protein INT46_011684 [Mucor plumbeus]
MRYKKRQKDVYIPGITKINKPTNFKKKLDKRSRDEVEEGGIGKKQRTEDDDNKRYADALESQFKKRLLQAIQSCINKENNLNELYTKLIQFPQFPKGIATQAEKPIGAFNHEIEKYLRKLLKELKKKTVEIWKEYIKNNFQKLKKTLVVEESQIEVDDP